MSILTGLAKRLAFLAMMALAIFGVGKTANAIMGVKPSSRAPILNVRTGDPELEAATAKARASLGAFWASLDRHSPDERGHSLKVRFPIGDGSAAKAENMWLNEIVHGQPGRYTGRLDNVPEYVKTYRIGQRLEFTDDMISDWMYLRNGKVVGNQTLRPLLARMPPEKARQIQAMLAEP